MKVFKFILMICAIVLIIMAIIATTIITIKVAKINPVSNGATTTTADNNVDDIDNNSDSRVIINRNENTIIINDDKVNSNNNDNNKNGCNNYNHYKYNNDNNYIKSYYDNDKYHKYTLKYLSNEYNDNMGKSRNAHENEYVEIPAYLINVNKEYALLTGTKDKTGNSYKVYALLDNIDIITDDIVGENNNSIVEVVIRGRIADINEKYHFEASIIVDEILIK